MVDGFIHRNEVAKEKGNGFRFEPVDGSGIAAAVLTAAGSRADDNYVYACAVRDRGDGNRQTLETGGSVANAITSVQKDSMVAELNGISVNPFSRKLEFKGLQNIKVDCSPALRATDYKCPLCKWDGLRIRKLTERECFRLMDVSESDIDKIQAAGISRTQQYKMAGNSIVVAVLYHIFRKMFIDKECETKQLKLF